MTLDEFRREMEAYWQSVHKEANKFKDPHIAQERMYALYRKFDAEERAMADQVLGEWVMSEDDNTRFDALDLIREFKIINAIPALKNLAKRDRGWRQAVHPARRGRSSTPTAQPFWSGAGCRYRIRIKRAE